MRWWFLPLTMATLTAAAVFANRADDCADCSDCAHKSAPAVRSLATRFTYKAVVPEVPKGTRTLNLWLPIPSDSPWQKVKELVVDSPGPYRITQEPKYGNRMVFVPVSEPSAPVTVTVSFLVERKEVRVLASHQEREKANACSSNCTCASCQESRRLAALAVQPETLVPVGGRFLTIANEITQGKTERMAKLRALYDHVVATFEYDYQRASPKLGEGDVAFVCDFRKGNCTDFHSYLISLVRSLGIPAYLEFGFALAGIPLPSPLPKEGKIGGYHCWTWLYDEQVGWFPVDASDARRWVDAGQADKKDYLFGNLVLERSAVAVSRGRDIQLEPKQKGDSLKYFIYPYGEADGQAVKVNWELTYQLP